MKIRIWCKPLLSLVLSLALVAATTPAQSPAGNAAPARAQQHVVSLGDLSQAASEPSQTRQTNEAELRSLIHSEAGQKAMKSLNVGYEKVDKAIGQLNDEDVSRLAERSRMAQRDFAAGGLGTTLIVAIVLIIVLVVVLTAVFH